MLWKIFKTNDDFVYIHADCFDDALERARQIDSSFNGGCVVDETREGVEHNDIGR